MVACCESAERSDAVVVENFNAGIYPARCLDVLSRRRIREFHTVVVGNASTDGSMVGIGERYSSVSLLRAGANLSFAAGNKHGLKHAVGSEWITLFNVDAIMAPDWPEKLIGATRTFLEISFSVAACYLPIYPSCSTAPATCTT